MLNRIKIVIYFLFIFAFTLSKNPNSVTFPSTNIEITTRLNANENIPFK